MSPDITPPELRECSALAEWLPWYAIGTLNAAERTDVEAHLETCAACRKSLEVERRIVDAIRSPRDNVEQSPHAGWQKMVAMLDAADGKVPVVEPSVRESRATMPSPAFTPVPKAARRRVNWPAALGAAVAVQAAAIAVLAVALVRHRQVASPVQIFRTVADPDATLAIDGQLVRIAFDSSVDEAQARSIATGAAGRIASGPSPENVYTFVFPRETTAGPALEEKVSGLRRQAHVLLAEPVVLSEQFRRE